MTEIMVTRIDKSDGKESLVTLDYALERLAPYYKDQDILRDELLGGRKVQSFFAYYQIVFQDIETPDDTPHEYCPSCGQELSLDNTLGYCSEECEFGNLT